MAAGVPSWQAPPWLSRWWAAKTPTERRIVAALALLIAAASGWLALWQPLQRDLHALRVAVPAERSLLADAQHRVDEMAGLARNSPLRPPPEARAELERVLGERGLRGNVTQLDWQEGRARIVFAAVRFDALIAALEALQRDARLRIVEATLTARVDPGTVRAELVLAR